MTGIYDFTILGALYTYLFIFFRSASCEAAMVVGLGFDFTIPCQYYSQSCFSLPSRLESDAHLWADAGLHTKELSAYWPKMMMGTVAEFACYLLIDDPDMFNMIVFGKTTMTMYLWMSTKKQWVRLFWPIWPRSDSQGRGSKTTDATCSLSCSHQVKVQRMASLLDLPNPNPRPKARTPSSPRNTSTITCPTSWSR